jgi:hypothetical protein
MVQTVEQVVKQHLQAARELKRSLRDPHRARQFLLQAGIAEKTRKTPVHPHGVRLAKRFR